MLNISFNYMTITIVVYKTNLFIKILICIYYTKVLNNNCKIKGVYLGIIWIVNVLYFINKRRLTEYV